MYWLLCVLFQTLIMSKLIRGTFRLPCCSMGGSVSGSSCRVFVLTSRSDHVIVYATAKLIMDGGLPNYRPTRLNDSGNLFRPLTKNRRFFHIFIFYLNSPNHSLHSCILLGVFLVGKSYCISIFNSNLHKLSYARL